MKKVEIIVRPERLRDVLEELSKASVPGFTVTVAHGAGRERGLKMIYRGGELIVRLIPKAKVEVVVPDDKVEEIVSAVSRVARTGEPGDGKIFIYDIKDAVRIRTGERGEDAL